MTWNASRYASNARFVSDLGLPVVGWLAPRAGERLLDLGCGDGVLTARLVKVGCKVTGIDASPAMVEAARALDLDARIADGACLAFDAEFDAVFSNAALHWMPSPAAVVHGVFRALKPGGRFVAEMGGHGNVATIVAALHGTLTDRGLPVPQPWYFPRTHEYRALLKYAGFRVRRMQSFERPTPLPGDIGGWLETFAHPYIGTLPAEEQAASIAEVVDRLRPELLDAESGQWLADYVRLRFEAVKPATG